MNRFLHAVWSRQVGPGYVTVARKQFDTGQWRERALRVGPNMPGLRGSATDDLYFTPVLFSEPNHRSENALPSRWLYADLDEADPARLPVELRPTLAWETSPDRFQCLWLIDRPLERVTFEAVNQRLTYLVGADRSGWDAAQLLRVPGTTSRKRGKPHRVRLLSGPRPMHRYEDVAAMVAHIDVISITVPTPMIGRLPDRDSVLTRTKLSPMDRRLLRETAASADRSGALWHLELRLFKAGLSCEEVYVLVLPTVWNKWRNRPQGLWREVSRAQQHYARSRSLASGADSRATRGTGRARKGRENL
jgi:hypothetical protein